MSIPNRPIDRLRLEFRIAAWIFWRYFWRTALFLFPFFLASEVLVAHAEPQLAGYLMLFAFFAYALFTVYLWRRRSLLGDLRLRSGSYVFGIHSPWSNAWGIGAILSWAYFWRQQIFCTTFVVVLGFIPSILGQHGLVWTASCLVLGNALGSVFAMWSMLFNPFGKTMVLVRPELT